MNEASVIIAGGGTGGHVYPGLALAEAILRERPDANVAFIGTARGIETHAVPHAGYELDLIEVMPWSRTLGAKRFLAPLGALRAARRSSAILRGRGATVVAGMGGYASFPAAIAARMSRVPLVLHEQNAIPGRANRFAARLTPNVAVTFSESVRYFRNPRVVGNPLRRAITTLDRAALRREAMEMFGLDPSRRTVLIFGGSQGAGRLNAAAAPAAECWSDRRDRQILLLSGDASVATAEHPLIARIGFTDRMDCAYAAADIVVCRSGAGVMEVACAGLPSILVPYPYARDNHQAANAQAMARAGASIVVDDAEATGPRLAAEVDAILGDAGRAREMGQAARAFARPGAAADLASWVLELSDRGSR